MQVDKNLIIMNYILRLQRKLLTQLNVQLTQEEQVYERALEELLGREWTPDILKDRATRLVTELVEQSMQEAALEFTSFKQTCLQALRESAVSVVHDAQSVSELRAV